MRGIRGSIQIRVKYPSVLGTALQTPLYSHICQTCKPVPGSFLCDLPCISCKNGHSG